MRENVEYLAELQAQARALGLLEAEGGSLVSFRPSISNAERASLLQDALCVLYTPDREHFGIVPLEVSKGWMASTYESRVACGPFDFTPHIPSLTQSIHLLLPPPTHQAMYAGSPVVAVASGGPLETIRDGETGFLRPGTAEGFADAIATMVRDPGLKGTMGRAGHAHVRARFGLDAFSATLEGAVRQTVAVAGKGGGAAAGKGRVWVLVVVVALLLLALVVVGVGVALALLVLMLGRGPK